MSDPWLWLAVYVVGFLVCVYLAERFPSLRPGYEGNPDSDGSRATQAALWPFWAAILVLMSPMVLMYYGTRGIRALARRTVEPLKGEK